MVAHRSDVAQCSGTWLLVWQFLVIVAVCQLDFQRSQPIRGIAAFYTIGAIYYLALLWKEAKLLCLAMPHGCFSGVDGKGRE